MKRTTRQESFDLDSMAQHIKPVVTWKQLTLPQSTLAKLKEICKQAKDRGRATSRERTSGKGLSVLFTGPNGAGKTKAIEAIANELGLELYRIDLSAVVGKYVGETEKNLDRVVANAEGKNWVLFFDEADALFGRRTEVRDAHDNYANQEISYLLQRIEAFAGIAIMASNMKSAIDPAFLRRLRFVVEFPNPDAKD